MRRVAMLVCVSLLLALSACAWTRRENRPLWTAYEENLVPESSLAFAVTLPATVPLGVLAILADTLIAHPLQVVDDALDDSADLWRGIDFEKSYYTQAGFVPLRAVATPVWLLGSFLGRSMFDIRSPQEADADRTQREERAHREILVWLQRIAAGDAERFTDTAPKQFDAELLHAFDNAQIHGTALGRLRLYEAAAASFAQAVDWATALADGSAVVRFRVLQILPDGVVLPPVLWQRLLADPDEAVRVLAARMAKR